MLGLLAKQRKMKTLAASELSLPDLFHRQSQVSIEDGRRGKRRKSRLLQQMQHKSLAGNGEVPVITVEESGSQDGQEGTELSNHPPVRQKADIVLPPIIKSNQEPSHAKQRNHPVNGMPSVGGNDASQGNDATSARESAGSRRAGSGATQRMTEAPLLVPHGTFLTREKTEAEQQFMPCGMLGGKKAKKDTLVRRAYLQLDLLKPGDVFGLDDIAQKFRFPRKEVEEDVEGLGLRLPPGVYPKDLGLENLDPPPIPVHEGPAISLVSDGAEVIKISKRFFLQHAQNNTMLRVETMQRSYLSTEEAKSILYDKETWVQYKNVLMQRLIDSLPR